VVRAVVASYDTLISLFERIHFFLERMNRYRAIPLTTAMVELLGKIMAQVLSILALSTKAMTEGRMSRSIHFDVPFFADYQTERFFKGLAGQKDIDDALLRLDTLTTEETVTTVARNLEVTHHVKELTNDIRDNVIITKDGARFSLTFILGLTFVFDARYYSNGPADTSVTHTALVDRQG
jgi:hypothetical protein